MPHVPQRMQTTTGSYCLDRIPAGTGLRAWDAADEYALEALSASHDKWPVLIVNDSFGALACALADRGATVWTDSYVAIVATRSNMSENGIDPGVLSIVPLPQVPAESEIKFRSMVIKVPKSLMLLEHQLRTIRPHVMAETQIIGAGMTRHVHTSTLKAFEAALGPTSTSLAKKKARLIYTTFDPELDPGPIQVPVAYDVGRGISAVTLPGVFSQRRLDIGTRFFLEHLPQPAPGSNILDLGCGNGAVGATLAKMAPTATVTFTDSSYLAVESARATVARNFPDRSDDHFVADNGGASLKAASYDLVVLNPPFHDQHAVGKSQAIDLFSNAKRLLKPTGELWIVGNRHLRYDNILKHQFSEVSIRASNPKFVILSAR